MEFKPFWDQLAHLGIELPEPYKIRVKEIVPVKPLGEKVPEPPAKTPERPPGRPTGKPSTPKDLPVETRWHRAGDTVTIAGYDIPGLIYLGDELRAVEHYRGIEPSLIQPKCFVHPTNKDLEGKRIAYNPSYGKLNGEQRAAYLHWLSTGRSQLNISHHYILMFIYGLERRVIHDLLNKPSPDRPAELTEIAQVLEQIQTTYTSNRNDYHQMVLKECLGRMLHIINLIQDPTQIRITDPFRASDANLRLAIGQMVSQKQPIPALWALAYCWVAMGHSIPASAQDYPEAFRLLFEKRYGDRYGEGLLIKPGKMKLRVYYNPTSTSFGNRSHIVPVDNIPDISRMTGQLAGIPEVIREARNAIESYTRYVNRNPTEKDSPKALGFLPPDVLSTWQSPGLKQVQDWLATGFSSSKVRHWTIPAKEIMPVWTGTTGAHITKAELKSIANLLSALGYGIEPDGRHVQIDVPKDQTIILYRLGADRPQELSPTYQTAALWVHLAIAVASGDQIPSPKEREAIVTVIPTIPSLTPSEQAKLLAHYHYILPQNPGLQRLGNRITGLVGSKADLGNFLVSVASCDGQLTPEEVKRLEKVYQMLGLEDQSLYSEIHQVNTGAAKPSGAKKTSNKLDMNAVRSKIAESQEISSLLSDIFTEDEPAGKPAGKPTAKPAAKAGVKAKAKTKAKAKGETLAGLDVAHSALLRAISKSSTWAREDLLSVAQSLNLMLDGALEVINEAAFDKCDEPLVEGHDSIEVDAEVMKELLS
jgi:hypothetical protein